MKKYWLFLVGPTVALFFSCNPARRIEMKNQSNDTAEVVWKARKDSVGFNPFVLSNNKELRFVLPPRKNSAVKMSFGMGNWAPAEVEKLIRGLESLEIKTAHHNMKIESLPMLKDYLLARRKGMGGSKIEIIIDP